MLRKYLLIAAVILLPVNANAVPFQIDFQVSGFGNIIGTDAAPTDPITGQIVYEATGIGATIDSLLSVDLTIDGLSYSLAGVGFLSPFVADADSVFGAPLGVNVATSTSGVDDFFLAWDRTLGTPISFLYTTDTLDSIWGSTNFDQFSITAVSVPEPSAISLICSGLLVVSFGLRRRRGRNTV
jgi:hypothetical protein